MHQEPAVELRPDDPLGTRRVAYLVSQYPTLSHAFIEREVAALRERGVEVSTFSVRPTGAADWRSETARREGEQTFALLGAPARNYAAAHARLLREAPRAWRAGMRAAMSAGPGGPRGRVWQGFYLTEAVVLLEQMRRRGLRHLHVHFANNGADVARLVTAMGCALDGPGSWRWTLSMHGPTEFTDPAGHDLAAKTRSAAAVACISDYCRGQLLGLLGADAADHAAKMRIVRMSVDGTRYPAGAAARLARPAGPLRVLFVGRLVPEKAPETLVAATAELLRRGVEATVRIVGEGPSRPALQRQVREAGLQEWVHLLGGVGQDDLPAQYAWADVFCLPSRAEGVPAVLMEAMSTELPTVTTRIAGIPELVADEVTGLLVEPGRVGAVADALQRLAADGGLRAAMGRAGRRVVLEEFDPQRNAERLLATWDPAAPVLLPAAAPAGRELA